MPWIAKYTQDTTIDGEGTATAIWTDDPDPGFPPYTRRIKKTAQDGNNFCDEAKAALVDYLAKKTAKETKINAIVAALEVKLNTP